MIDRYPERPSDGLARIGLGFNEEGLELFRARHITLEDNDAADLEVFYQGFEFFCQGGALEADHQLPPAVAFPVVP